MLLIKEVIKELIKHTGYTVAQSHTLLREGESVASEHAIVTLKIEKKTYKYFVKMARTCNDSGRILREINTLNKLKSMNVKNIPEIKLFGACEGREYLIENFIDESKTSHSPLSEDEILNKILEWIGQFYSQTRNGTIEPKELVNRVQRVSASVDGFIDLTDALYVLDKSKPHTKIPAVCRHGDIADINFIPTRLGLVAVDFGFAKFNEPPSEPYALVSPVRLKGDTKFLDVLSELDGVDPFFLAIYENIIRLGEEIRMLNELEANLLVANRIGYFVPQAQLGNIEMLKLCYHEQRRETNAMQ
jgi:hypothetical protein